MPTYPQYPDPLLTHIMHTASQVVFFTCAWYLNDSLMFCAVTGRVCRSLDAEMWLSRLCSEIFRVLFCCFYRRSSQNTAYSSYRNRNRTNSLIIYEICCSKWDRIFIFGWLFLYMLTVAVLYSSTVVVSDGNTILLYIYHGTTWLPYSCNMIKAVP